MGLFLFSTITPLINSGSFYCTPTITDSETNDTTLMNTIASEHEEIIIESDYEPSLLPSEFRPMYESESLDTEKYVTESNITYTVQLQETPEIEREPRENIDIRNPDIFQINDGSGPDDDINESDHEEDKDGSKSTDTIVAGTDIGEINPSIACDSQGYYYVAVEHQGSSDPAIDIYRSTDHGQTWNVWKVVGVGSDRTDPCLAVGDGVEDWLFMAYVRGGNTLYVARIDLSNPSNIDYTSIESGVVSISNPKIVTDCDEYNKWYAYLIFNSEPISKGLWSLRYCRSTDYGETWSSPSTIASYCSGYNAANAEPDIDYGSEVLYVAYDDFPPGCTSTNRDIYVMTSTNDGVSWDTPVRITSYADDEYDPVVAAVNQGDTAQTAIVGYTWYYTGSDYNARTKYTQDGGSTWSTASACLSCAVDDKEISVDLASSWNRGYIHACFWNENDIYYRYANYLTPYSWSSPILINELSYASGVYTRSSIAFDPTESDDEGACIVWTDYRNLATMGYDVYFDSLNNNPPNTPSNGVPKHLSTDVSIDADLSWSGGDPDPGDTVVYDVYFGTDPTPDAGELVSDDQSGTSFNLGTLLYETQYYWKIVAKDNHGETTSGPIWTFTTEAAPNSAPYVPSSPSPTHQSTDISINADLSWSGGDPDPGDTVVYDVYFGTDPTPDAGELVSDDQTGTTYNPGTLAYKTQYYWKIIAYDNHGESSSSPIWTFITEEEPLKPDLIITDIWLEDDLIHYQIHNIGEGQTSGSHKTSLKINDIFMTSETIVTILLPDERFNGIFSNYQWTCDGFDNSIAVTADYQDQQAEDNEVNNGRTENWLCDTTPPEIVYGPIVSGITEESVVIQWQTDEDSDSKVQFGANAGLFDDEQTDSQYVKDHVMTLIDLSSSTTYHYMVTSSDASGNNITSQECYFTTGNVYDDMVPIMLFFNRTDTIIPYTYSFFGSDNIGIDRVEFSMDGEYIGTSYSAPFKQLLHPVILGLSISQLYAEHTFTATAFDLEDNTNTMFYTEAARPPPCNEVELEIRYPLGWNAILYTDDVVVHDTILDLQVYAREKRGLTQVCDEMGHWHPQERYSEVAELEFYIDDDMVCNCSPSSTTTTCPWDAEGLSLGEHIFGIAAYDHTGCRHYEEQIINVTQSLPRIIISNDIDRYGNYFDMEFYIRNTGHADAVLEQLNVTLVGFQAIAKTATDYTVQPEYSPTNKRCYVDVDFTSGFILSPGSMITVQFNAVPILFELTVSKRLDVSITYEDNYGDEHFEEYSDFEGRAYLASIADDAFLDADYLMITNPDNLFLFNNDADVNTLLSTMADLATLRNGVLGYYYTYGTLMTKFDSNDLLVTGDFVNDDRDEIVIGEIDPGKDGIIRTYCGSYELTIRGELPFNHIGLHSNDALAVGNVDGDDGIYGGPNNGAEIVVADGNGDHQGRITIYQYIPAHDMVEGIGHFDSAYSGGDGFAVGNVNNDDDELEIIVANTDGVVDGYDLSWYYGWQHDFSYDTVFRSGDCFAIGDVIGDDKAEIVVGDIDDDRILIYEGNNPDGHVLCEFTRTLNAGDQIAVGDVWDDEKDEIIIASDTYDRIYVYSWNHRSGWGDMNLITSHPKSFDDRDTLAVGRIVLNDKEKIIIGRGSTEADHHEGEVEIFDCMGSRRPGDKYGLDELINEDGRWALKMGDDWVDNGYLLLVGETEIIPAWGGKSWVKESCWWIFCSDVETVRTDLTDYPYASTQGSEIRPELSMGRIIGNNAERLTKVLETSINVVREETGYNFDRSDAFVVSSYNACLDGGCDDINFRSERDAVGSILTDAGVDVLLMHNPDFTQYDPGDVINESATISLIRSVFFANTPDKDIIFLAGHGNKNLWDGGADDTILDTNLIWHQPAFYGSTNPFVYASSCLTGRYAGVTSLAEAFLWRGAGVYLGATESGRCCSHADVTRAFFREWDSGESIAEAVKQVKQSLSDDAYDRFWAAIYHVYGDAKYGSEGPPAKQTSKDTFQPTTIINISIPSYTVNHTEDEDIVEILGGNRLFVPGAPLVPIYRECYEYPQGYVIQDVQLVSRSEPTFTTGLNIPDCEIGLPSRGSGIVYTDQADPEQWPRRLFEWNTYQVSGTTTLAITVYPFYYNSLTTNVEFYDYYQFQVNYTTTCINQSWLILDNTEYEQGDTITADIYLNCSLQAPLDLLVETTVSSNEPDITVGLPLRMLYDAQGFISFSQTWNSTGFEGGSYLFTVLIKDSNGTLLCEMTEPFTLGSSSLELTGFTIDPQVFDVGDDLTFSLSYENTGTTTASGTLILEIDLANGTEVDRIMEGFSDLEPLDSDTFTMDYETSVLEEGTYTVKGYIIYDATSTVPLSLPISTESLPETNEPPCLYDEIPSHVSTQVERPPATLSISVEDPDQDDMSFAFKWKNHQGQWIAPCTYGNMPDGTYTCTPPSNADWLWGNTTYTWSVNVTDGTSWTNQTFTFTTGGSRYDVNNDNKVNFIDAGIVWVHRTTNAPYDGLYDVNQDGNVNFIDAGKTWVNRD
jgi:uncharacterized repeat protein (TIGR01451 family)